MGSVLRNSVVVCVIMLTTFTSKTLEEDEIVSIDLKPTLNNDGFSKDDRLPRQNKKQKLQKQHYQSPGLFTAISSLLGGTVSDTFTAYRNVSRLVQTAFAPPRQTTGNATSPTTGSSFTLREALGLLGRNYRGLRRLFDTEFTKALNDSMKNALDFRKELKKSVRMYIEFPNGEQNAV